MKNIKEIVFGICAAFGVFVAISGFTNGQEDRQSTINECSVPESHEWEVYINTANNGDYLLNKKTGEIRLISPGRKEAYKIKMVD